MAENKNPELNYTTVEVVEELSPEEASDRQRLELKVERAFYESGKALLELRSRRLYRSTHSNFEAYCRERFGFTRQNANYSIAGASVVDNLLKLTTNCCQILPTKESQVRPLSSLKPDEQVQVWQEAVEQSGNKVPSARLVKDLVSRHLGIVERLKRKNPPPPEFTLGDVIEIKAVKHSPLRQFNAMWGIIQHVGSFSYTVRVSIARDTQQCKTDEMTRIDDEYTADIKAVAGRIEWLAQNFELESIEYDILANLQRSKCFTPKQLMLLGLLEQQYGIV